MTKTQLQLFYLYTKILSTEKEDLMQTFVETFSVVFSLVRVRGEYPLEITPLPRRKPPQTVTPPGDEPPG